MIHTDGQPTIANYQLTIEGKEELHKLVPAPAMPPQRKPMFAVDWDGTCVTDSWPAMGTWMPGAIDALHQLAEMGHVTIFTCRIAPLEFAPPHLPRPKEDVQREVDGIRSMLDAAGLYEEAVSIWTQPFKPPALAYIDNRAQRYLGKKRSWEVMAANMKALYG